MLGRYPGLMPPKSQMFGNPGFGMWNRQGAQGGVGAGQLAQTLGQTQPAPTQGPQGLLAQALAQRANPNMRGGTYFSTQTPQPNAGANGMISPDMLRQLMGGMFGGLS